MARGAREIRRIRNSKYSSEPVSFTRHSLRDNNNITTACMGCIIGGHEGGDQYEGRGVSR